MSTKTPGLFKDPWRDVKPEPVVEKAKPSAPVSKRKPPVQTGIDEIHEDIREEIKYATLEIKGYGGITVDGTSDLTAVAAQILAYCVDNLATVDETLVYYGVVVTVLDAHDTVSSNFYVRRADGWTLAVPQAPTREAGCLQLIQAMNKLYTQKNNKRLMEKYRIRPFKM